MSRFVVTVRHMGLACALCGVFALGDSIRSKETSDTAVPGLTVGPDIVASFGPISGVFQLGREGPIGSGTVGLGVGTTMCNKGDQTIDVLRLPDVRHQVIVANAYRWSEPNGADRLEQIGQSWVKHTFGSKNVNSCLFGCDCTQVQCELNNLAPGCSDSYVAAQFVPCGLGPRSAVHPFTGVMPGGGSLGSGGTCGSANFPASNHLGHDHPGAFFYTGIDHRLQVRDVDLIPELNAGARYYAEGQYITADEFISGNGNQHNNVAHREISVSGPDEVGLFQFSFESDTFSESPALDAWEGASQTVIEPAPLVDGRAILAYKVTPLGGDVWHYEYAIYNMNMDRAIESFSIPIVAGVQITNIGFHAPLNHTEQPNTETFSNDPWTVDLTGEEIQWHTDSFAVDPQANAIRYGTLYNFRFDANGPPQSVSATVGLFKTGDTVAAITLGPTLGAPLAEPDGSNKNRFISFAVPTAVVAGVAAQAAIQIELATLNHVCSADSANLFQPCTTDGNCINGVCDKPFYASEGELRYVNVVKTCQGGAMSTGEVICRSLDDCAIDEECLQMRMCDGTTDLCASNAGCSPGVPCLASMSCPDDVFQPSFLCATTGCEPEYRDWASELAGGVLHVYGPGIVPARSEYNLRQIPAACAGNEASCASASEALMLATARWADLTADGATDARDITAASDKVKPIPEAFTKVRTMLIPGILDPFRNVNVLELQNTVDAVKSLPMSGFITGPEDCGG